MKITLAQYDAGGFTIFHDKDRGDCMEEHASYIRLTEFAEVEFKLIRSEEVIEKQLKQIDAAEAELREKFQQKLDELNTKRADLRALTHESA